jgi:two-component system, NarL family, response regulator LiaR
MLKPLLGTVNMSNSIDFLPLRIVIIEDDPMMQLGLKHSLLSQSQIEIIGIAEDGRSGVETVIALQPDIVIMDIGLPQMDGIAATEAIRVDSPHVRVIILTSHTSETEIIAALSCGADAYCVKGISLKQLMQAIQVVMDGSVYLDAPVAHQVIECLRPPIAVKRGSTQPIGQLSAQELKVLELIVEGYSNPEIGATLNLSTNTVKGYIRSIMNKLAVNDRVQAAVTALRSGLVE